MHQPAKLIRNALMTFLVSYPLLVHAYGKISPSVFLLLTPWCQDVYETIYSRAGWPSPRASNPSRYPPGYWAKRVGPAKTPGNHYCPALAALVKAQYPSLIHATSGQTVASLARAAQGGVQYFITYNKSHNAWRDSNKWLLAEAYSKMGDIKSLLDQPQESIDNYRKAVSAFPKYVPAYMGMAKEYEALKLYPEAIAALKQAHKYRPESKFISKKIAELESKKATPGGRDKSK